MRPAGTFLRWSKSLRNTMDKMRIREVMYLADWRYYLCPRCAVTLDREFQNYCDRCGQKLDWSGYRKARLIYPNGTAAK